MVKTKLFSIALLALVCAGVCFAQSDTMPKIILQRSEIKGETRTNFLELLKENRQRSRLGLGTFDEVLFTNSKGDTVKRIPLLPDTIAKNGKYITVKYCRPPILSVNKQWLGLKYVTRKKYIDQDIDSIIDQSYEIKYFNINGEMLWAKYYNEETGFKHIANDGKYVLITTYEPEKPELVEYEYGRAILVFNEKGEQVFRIPEKGFTYFNTIMNSPNGRYMSIYPYNGQGNTTFFDLQTKKTITIEKDIAVYRITDDGKAKVVEQKGEKKTQWLDLYILFGDK